MKSKLIILKIILISFVYADPSDDGGDNASYLGDINMDEVVNVVDIVILIEIIPNPIETDSANITHDVVVVGAGSAGLYAAKTLIDEA